MGEIHHSASARTGQKERKRCQLQIHRRPAEKPEICRGGDCKHRLGNCLPEALQPGSLISHLLPLHWVPTTGLHLHKSRKFIPEDLGSRRGSPLSLPQESALSETWQPGLKRSHFDWPKISITKNVQEQQLDASKSGHKCFTLRSEDGYTLLEIMANVKNVSDSKNCSNLAVVSFLDFAHIYAWFFWASFCLVSLGYSGGVCR